MSNAISTFILATSLQMALKHVDKSGLIKRLAEDIDKLSDDRLGKRSEKFQEEMVVKLLLPLCRELMYEDRQRYVQLLESEQYGNFGQSERKPYGRDGELKNESWGPVEPGPGSSSQNFGPKVR